MVRFTGEELSGLEKLIQISNESRDADTFRKRITPVIHSLLRSDSTIFWFTDNSGSMVDPHALNIDLGYLSSYLTYYFRQNPFDPVNVGIPPKSENDRSA